MSPGRSRISLELRVTPQPCRYLRAVLLGIAIRLTCHEYRYRVAEPWGIQVTPWRRPTWRWVFGHRTDTHGWSVVPSREEPRA